MKMEQNISTVRSYGLMLIIFGTQLRMVIIRTELRFPFKTENKRQMTWHVSTGGAILASVGRRKR